MKINMTDYSVRIIGIQLSIRLGGELRFVFKLIYAKFALVLSKLIYIENKSTANQVRIRLTSR